jgi:F-type H+-transporting ATPase subunit c
MNSMNSDIIPAAKILGAGPGLCTPGLLLSKLGNIMNSVNFDIIPAAKILGAGAATIGIGGAGTGVGHVFGAFMLACSRNPGMEMRSFRYVLIGFASTEAVGLPAPMMAFLLLFT